MSRVTILLTDNERIKLVQLAQAELRTPRDQARFMLREALQTQRIYGERKPAPSATSADRADLATHAMAHG